MRRRTSRPQPGDKPSAARVLLAGKHGLLTDALKLALNSEKMVVSVATSVDGSEIAKQVDSLRPDVVVLPDSDPEVTVDLIETASGLGCPTVTISDDSNTIASARFFAAGAASVVGFDSAYSVLVDTIKRVSTGEIVLPLEKRYRLEQQLREHREAESRRVEIFDELSPKERAVFALIYEGFAADQIAEVQCVSLSTVRTHIRNILIKLNVHSQLAAVALARSNSWFTATRAED